MKDRYPITSTYSDISYGYDITSEMEKLLSEELSKSINSHIIKTMLGQSKLEKLEKILKNINDKS